MKAKETVVSGEQEREFGGYVPFTTKTETDIKAQEEHKREMTEKLSGKIAKIVWHTADNSCIFEDGSYPCPEQEPTPQTCADCAVAQILALYKEAGYLSPEETRKLREELRMGNVLYAELTDKMNDYVRLADDQSLPDPRMLEFVLPIDTLMVSRAGIALEKNLSHTYSKGQKDMLKVVDKKVWRKVEKR